VRVVEPGGGITDEADRATRVEPAAGPAKHFTDIGTVDVVHFDQWHTVGGDLEIGDSGDVGRRQPGEQIGFLGELAQHPFVEGRAAKDFQSYRPVGQARMGGLVDRSHAAFAELPNDSVALELRTVAQNHVRPRLRPPPTRNRWLRPPSGRQMSSMPALFVPNWIRRISGPTRDREPPMITLQIGRAASPTRAGPTPGVAQ